MNLTRKLFLGLCILSSVNAWAEPVDAEGALSIASQFCTTGTSMRRVPAKNQTLTLAVEQPGYYIFNRGTESGYVIVASDDAVTNQVMGYCDEGHITSATIPAPLQSWLAEMQNQVLYAAQHPQQVQQRVREHDTISPLVTCQWSQDDPFHNLCPFMDGQYAPTGCTATATSQVMYSHRYPEHGTGTVSNSAAAGSIDLSTETYRWDLMKDKYDANSSEESKTAVATLMRDVGYAMKMQYSITWSGAYIEDAAAALINNFNYDKGIIFAQREMYSKTEWDELIYAELAAGRALLYSGYYIQSGGSLSGHTFVCDGYKGGYYHINWGWGSLSDGYFLLDVLDPSAQGTGGSAGGYNYLQQAVIGIQPPTASNKLAEIIYCGANLTCTQRSASRTNGTLTIGGRFSNYAMGLEVYTLGLEVVDSEGNSTYLSAARGVSLGSRENAQSFSVSTENFPAASGDYTLYPVFKGPSGIWQRMHTKCGCRDHLLAKADESTITISNPTESSYQMAATLKASNQTPERGANVVFTATVSCTKGSYYGKTSVILVKDGKTASTSDVATIAVEEGDPKEVTYTLSAPTTDGLYEAYVVDENNTRLNEPLYMQVGSSSATVKLTKAIEMADQTSVDKNNIQVHAQVTCASGNYLGTFSFMIYGGKYHNKQMGSITSEQYLIREGETVDVVISGALSTLEDNTTYLGYILDNKLAYFNGQETLDNLTFTTSDGTGIADLTADDVLSVYTLSGQQVLQQATLQTVRQLPHGCYVIRRGNKSYKLSR